MEKVVTRAEGIQESVQGRAVNTADLGELVGVGIELLRLMNPERAVRAESRVNPHVEITIIGDGDVVLK